MSAIDPALKIGENLQAIHETQKSWLEEYRRTADQGLKVQQQLLEQQSRMAVKQELAFEQQIKSVRTLRIVAYLCMIIAGYMLFKLFNLKLLF